MTLMALRAKNELVAAKTDEERAAIIARIRRVDSDLADELAEKFPPSN